jgi:hypothetical protein
MLRLELLDRLEQRIVLGLVEALDPPDGELFLGAHLPGERQCEAGDDTDDRLPHGVSLDSMMDAGWHRSGRPYRIASEVSIRS